MNKKYLKYAEKFPAEKFICKDPPPPIKPIPIKLKKLSFDNELQRVERGDSFVVYSPGVSGWLRHSVGHVIWPYVYPAGSPMPTHASHVWAIEKQDGTRYER